MIFVLFIAILLGLVTSVLVANWVLMRPQTVNGCQNCETSQAFHPPGEDDVVNCPSCAKPNKGAKT